jgi:OmpA-OmpF porin, OOP family
MKRISAVAMLLATFSMSAFAADSGFYTGGTVGQSSTSLDNVTLSKKSDTAFSLLGGYKINQNLGVEAEYVNLGKVSSTTAWSADISAIAATAVVAIPVYTDFAFYGKLGFAKTSFGHATNGIPVSRTTATFGLGGQFKIDPSLDVRVGWDRYAVGDAVSGNSDLIAVGIVYNFN